MLISLDILKPNPFRDFSLYPVDREQVQRLSQSISELGFFAGVTARKDLNGSYELAAGHHRIEAARLAGLSELDVLVKPYSDVQMVQIMTKENMTQRGHNAAAVLDSVAAFSRVVAKEILLGEGSTAKILATVGKGALEGTQAKVAKDGPGKDLLYRAINGFAKKERKDNKQAETMTETEISQALGTLKASGRMAQIVVEVYEEIDAARPRAERREQEHVAIEELRHAEAAYDPAVASVFRLMSHEASFRSVVLSEPGRRFIPVDQQLPLARALRSEIDVIEKKRSMDLGGLTIRQRAHAHLVEAIHGQRDIDAEEKERLLRDSARARVEERWATVRRGLFQAEGALRQLAEEQEKWPYDKALFPMDYETLWKFESMLKTIIKVKKTL